MGDQRGDTQVGTLLTVRANLADLGARPVYPSWNSPDIYQPSGDIIEVTVGTSVQLIALVNNFGDLPAYAVRVTFWAADSGLGISKAAADPPIGTSAPQTVAGAPVEFWCDTMWTPEAVSPGAHPCLVVQAEGVNCPIKQPFRPDLDPQVGQHNLTIKPSGGQFKLIAFNPFDENAPTQIFARSLKITGERLDEFSNAMLVEASRPEIRRLLRKKGIVVEEQDPSSFLRLLDVGHAEEGRGRHRGNTSSLHAGVPVDQVQGRPIGECDLPAGGAATLLFESRSNRAEPGEAFVHELVQVSSGLQVGGYSFLER